MSLPIIDLGILSGLAVLQWLFLLRQRNNPPRREAVFSTGDYYHLSRFHRHSTFLASSYHSYRRFGQFYFQRTFGNFGLGTHSRRDEVKRQACLLGRYAIINAANH